MARARLYLVATALAAADPRRSCGCGAPARGTVLGWGWCAACLAEIMAWSGGFPKVRDDGTPVAARLPGPKAKKGSRPGRGRRRGRS